MWAEVAKVSVPAVPPCPHAGVRLYRLGNRHGARVQGRYEYLHRHLMGIGRGLQDLAGGHWALEGASWRTELLATTELRLCRARLGMREP